MTLLPAAFFIDGLTLLCLAGTIILLAVFGFLYFAEKSVHKPE